MAGSSRVTVHVGWRDRSSHDLCGQKGARERRDFFPVDSPSFMAGVVVMVSYSVH